MSFLQFTKDDLMRGIELLVMALLGLVVLLLVVRPLVRRVITPDEAALPPPQPAPEQSGQPAQIASQGAVALTADHEPMSPGLNKTAKMIDIAQVKGQVHAQSVQKVGELADSNPNEAVAVIRQWLNEAA